MQFAPPPSFGRGHRVRVADGGVRRHRAVFVGEPHPAPLQLRQVLLESGERGAELF